MTAKDTETDDLRVHLRIASISNEIVKWVEIVVGGICLAIASLALIASPPWATAIVLTLVGLYFFRLSDSR